MIKTAISGFKTLLEIDKKNEDDKAFENTQKKITECEEILSKKPKYEGEWTVEYTEDLVEKLFQNYYDYDQRFVGHANCQTDIKEANFLGDSYIAAGSDCGNLFIWHRSGTVIE